MAEQQTSNDAGATPVSDSVRRGLAHARKNTQDARRWLAYYEAAEEWYEEWVRTGTPPEREYPRYEPDPQAVK